MFGFLGFALVASTVGAEGEERTEEPTVQGCLLEPGLEAVYIPSAGMPVVRTGYSSIPACRQVEHQFSSLESREISHVQSSYRCLHLSLHMNCKQRVNFPQIIFIFDLYFVTNSLVL